MMYVLDQPIRLPNRALLTPPGLLVYTFHANERIVPALSWVQVVTPFDGTTPELKLYAYVPGHEGDDAYLWSANADLATVSGHAASGEPDVDHQQTDTSMRRGLQPINDAGDHVWRDYGAKLYALIDAGGWPPGTFDPSGSTTGYAAVHLTTWTPAP